MAKKYLLKYNLQFFAENEGNGNDDPDQTGEGDGAGTTGEGTGTNTGDDTGTGTSGKGEKTFNQRQVSAMMTKEKKQGRNAAFAELGIDPNNAQQVAMVKALIESQKTDEQKMNEEAAAQAAKVAEVEHRAMVAEAKAEAMKSGAKAEYVDDIVALAMTKIDDKNDLESVISDLPSFRYRPQYRKVDRCFLNFALEGAYGVIEATRSGVEHPAERLLLRRSVEMIIDSRHSAVYGVHGHGILVVLISHGILEWQRSEGDGCRHRSVQRAVAVLRERPHVWYHRTYEDQRDVPLREDVIPYTAKLLEELGTERCSVMESVHYQYLLIIIMGGEPSKYADPAAGRFVEAAETVHRCIEFR